jgi:hypothetical protein
MTIEDPTRPYPASIEGIGLSVFVTDAFVDECLEHPRPYLAETFFDRMLEGGRRCCRRRRNARRTRHPD